MKVIFETSEQYKDLLIEVADAIKAKITFEEKDFWSQIPVEIKNKVHESQEQYAKGKHTEFAIVKEILLHRKHRE